MTQVMAPWLRVSFTVLDILLVALIIYEVLVMIRGTRAAPMLAGLAAVALCVSSAHATLWTTNFNISALMTKMKKPSVTRINGMLRNSRIGRTKALIIPSRSEAPSKQPIPV